MSNTDEETLEGNAIIAEFMGEKISQNGMIEFQSNGFGLGTKTLHKMEYHSSWDWIMPVIEKIEKKGYYTNILSADNDNTKHTIHITPLDDNEQYTIWFNSKIEAAWIGVVKFIKFYNKNKTS